MSDPADERDRQALELVQGHPLSEGPWPETALAAGARVRVIHDPDWAGPWATEFLAVIDTMVAPEPVQHPHAHAGEWKYWVTFDEPQFDDVDGPYRKAQIWGIPATCHRLAVGAAQPLFAAYDSSLSAAQTGHTRLRVEKPGNHPATGSTQEHR